MAKASDPKRKLRRNKPQQQNISATPLVVAEATANSLPPPPSLDLLTISPADPIQNSILPLPLEPPCPSLPLASIPWDGDSRVEWLRQTICLAFDVSQDVFDEFLIHDNEEGHFIATFIGDTECCLLLYLYNVAAAPRNLAHYGLTVQPIVDAISAPPSKGEPTSQDLQAEAPPSSSPGSNKYFANVEESSLKSEFPMKLLRAALVDYNAPYNVMYFVKLESGKLEGAQMQKCLEYGVLPIGASLSALEKVLTLACALI